jgi:hypothetical protein
MRLFKRIFIFILIFLITAFVSIFFWNSLIMRFDALISNFENGQYKPIISLLLGFFISTSGIITLILKIRNLISMKKKKKYANNLIDEQIGDEIETFNKNTLIVYSIFSLSNLSFAIYLIYNIITDEFTRRKGVFDVILYSTIFMLLIAIIFFLDIYFSNKKRLQNSKK